jgi:hypothetical protein
MTGTHHLRDITYIPTYISSIYTGKAVKMSAGVRAFEIYAAAKSFNVTVVGGEGRVCRPVDNCCDSSNAR